MTEKEIEALIKKMTLEEKAVFCSGADVWHLKSNKRLGIKSIMVSDGPHGLRTQREESDNLGINGSIAAVCFPAACATAASFDRELSYKIGETLGKECLAEGVSVLLGPAMNIKRTPLCGRNFEYFSEDPYLSGELAKEYVEGVQSNGVGVSVKHFALNNQETDRMVVSADVGERAFREIYLSGFETVVKEASPYTIMCSYNRVNGEYASQNGRLLTDILRGEWKFGGFVMSDWGAVVDRVKGLAAGLDLEMPGGDDFTDKQIAAAVQTGELDEKILDEAVKRILRVAAKCKADEENAPGMDLVKGHEKAVEAARECLVLLKNDDGILPLKRERKIAFIGEFAKRPRYQGGGSSHIHTTHCTAALDSAAKYAQPTYARGYSLSDAREDEALRKEAVKLAMESEAAVLFIGLPDSFESEGYDRTHLQLPDGHNRLVEEVAAVQPNTVVVLHNGAPVEMPWADKAKGILEAYLGGEGIGEATADVLFGAVNPSGKLPESFPLKLADTPAYLNFPGDNRHCRYAEGIYVGYRYYDKKEMPVLFPFGHGLSYTQFEYSALSAEGTPSKGVTVRMKIRNVGERAGKEVVQLYVGNRTGKSGFAVRELRGFEKICLAAGEEKEVEFSLGFRAFAYYDEKISDWKIAAGKYEIAAGSSSRDLRLTCFTEEAEKTEKIKVDLDTTLGELYENPATRNFVEARIEGLMKKSAAGGSVMGIAAEKDTLLRLVSGVPLRGLISIMKLTRGQMEGVIAALNAASGSK